VAIACTMTVLVAAPCPAEAQEYHGKLTVGAYAADDQVTTDFKVRYSAGASRTNLKPYANLTFDPNESWQLGAGAHLGKADSITAFAIWDNRLHTGQQNSHLLFRHYLPHSRRLTVDVSYKSGRDDDGVYIRGSAQAMEYDWHRWFVKLARDQHVNFTPATMWRAGGGLRF
jgi:hypothetical protein